MAKKNEQKIKFEADISGFKKNIKEAEKSITSLNATLKLNKTQLAGNGSSTQLLGQRIDELKQKYQQQTIAISETEKAYSKAVEYFGENSKEAENLSKKLIDLRTAQQRTANEISEVNKQLIIQSEKFITAGKNITKLGDNLNNFGKKIDSAGNKLSVLSAGIATIAGASLKASISFESAWTGVTKTVDGTEEQLNNLRQGMLDLSKQIPSSAEEIASVGEAAGQLGIQTDNVLKFTKTMIDMGNATNLSADDAATTLARFANVTKMSQSDFDRLGSVIVALGNNFATTESEIANMGMNLGSAGKQVGMSQSQIMALATALSSVGLEAQAGGTAFSKVMINMQLAVEKGGKNLKDFASVAGMTTNEFKKAFEEDATTAIMKFVEGLSKSGERGKSAIKILDDMGITETRLRDALLRSANASDIMSKAIDLGNKAWKENNALTSEADKRYATTESQLKILKNEIRANAIELGDDLKPSLIDIMKQAKPLISNVSNLVKGFNNLSGKTKKSVTNFLLMTAALGPAVKVSGKMISTTGSMISNYGKLITKVGDWSSKIKIASTTETIATTAKKAQTAATTASTVATEVNTGALVAQTSVTTGATIATNLLKVAMIGLPIVGVVAGIASLVGMYKEMTSETTQTTNKIKEQKEEMEQLREEQQREMESNLSQIDNVQRLKDELTLLVDKNGKVKDGYEARAKFILGELNEALGTEYKVTDGVIKKYDELSDKIDNLILKKKAEIILETQEERYKNAIKERAKATELLTQKQEELKNKEKEIDENRQKLIENETKYDGVFKEQIENRIKQLEKEKNSINDNIKTQSDVIQTYINDISTYETNATLVAEGTEESLKKVTDSIYYNQQRVSDNSILTLQAQINSSASYLQQLKSNYESTGSEITNNQIKEEQKRLTGLINSLTEQTSVTQEMTPELVSAWENLANLSYEEYSNVLSKMTPEMQEKIQSATGVIVNNTPYAKQVSDKFANTVVDSLDKDEEFKKQAVESLNSYLAGLSNEEKRELLKQAGIKNLDEVMEGLEKGRALSEDKGVEILKGLSTGLKNTKWQDSLFGIAGRIASKLTSAFSIKASVNTNKLPGHKDGLAYVPYDNYVARLHKGERVLTAKENKEYMSDNINNKIANNNIVLNFYPQKMTDAEMDRAFDYVNRKYSLKYN